MKNALFFVLGIIILFTACNGSDHDGLADDYCYMVINITSISGAVEGSECDITFLFIDEFGNEYESVKTVPRETGSTIIALPKNRCYDAWVLDSGNGVCGDYDFSIHDPSTGGSCYTFTEHVEERPDAYGVNNPEYSFCLGDECKCPEITEG